jgi:hypothetical protein
MLSTLVVASPLVAALCAVAVIALLQRRRLLRLTTASGLHHVLGDAHASWIVDHAVKTLVEACHLEPRLVPGIVMIVLRDTTIAVHVASPTAHPPVPWRTSADGLVWTADIVALQAARLSPSTANPYTGLVTLGVAESGRVFVDLTEAHGLVSIGGDPESRRLVAARWIAEAASRPWTTGAAHLIGLDADAAPRPAPASAVDQLADAVASGTPGLGVVHHLAHDATSARLVQALETHGCRFPVVVADAVPDARWRFTAHTNGWLTSDFLPAARWIPDAEVPPTPALPAATKKPTTDTAAASTTKASRAAASTAAASSAKATA